jgi:hypothetical protein
MSEDSSADVARQVERAFFMCQGDPYRSPVHNRFYGGHTDIR